jgi:voltage-dependent potassium channel beta subunit
MKVLLACLHRYNPKVLGDFGEGETVLNYRRMGQTGLRLSELSFGAWITFGDQIDDRTASDLIHKAYEAGINYFDNADIYAHGRAEQVMGVAIQDLPRESLVISSKLFWQTMDGPNGEGLSRKHIFESVEASLRRLKTDYLDLYFCHRYDPNTPVEETIRAMDDLVHQGKVLYWGTSQWRAGQIANAHRLANQWNLYPPRVEQPHYNMFHRQTVEDELVAGAADFGYGLVTYSPLELGLLSGKYDNTMPPGTRLARAKDWAEAVLTEARLEKVRLLADVAKDLGVTMAQLAIGWLLRWPQVTSVITGATRLSQLDENLGAVEVIARLDEATLARIEAILGNQPEPHED